MRDGVPYAIDFMNCAPDADVASVGQENFDWIVRDDGRVPPRPRPAPAPVREPRDVAASPGHREMTGADGAG